MVDDYFSQFKRVAPSNNYFSQFKRVNNQPMEFSQEEQLEQVRQQHPFLAPIAEKINQSPMLANMLQKAAPGIQSTRDAFEGTGLPALAGGLAQGAHNVVASVGNIPNYLGVPVPRFEHLDLRNKYSPGIMSTIGFEGGNIAAQIPFWQRAAATKMPQMLRGIENTLKGAGAGFTLGESKTGDRGLATFLGAAAGAGADTINAVKNKLIPWVQKHGASNIGEKVKQIGTGIKQNLNKDYSAWERDAAKATMGKKPTKVPQFNIYDKSVGKETNKNIDRFLKKPTVQNAFELQKNLNKASQTFSESAAKNKSMLDKEMSNELQADRKKVQDFIDATLRKNQAPHLAEKYKELSNRYRDYATIFKGNPAYTKVTSSDINKKITPEKFGEQLIKQKYPYFNQEKVISENVPELQGRINMMKKYQTTKNIGKAGGVLGIGGGGLFALGKWLGSKK